jgi:hypothetical protein
MCPVALRSSQHYHLIEMAVQHARVFRDHAITSSRPPIFDILSLHLSSISVVAHSSLPPPSRNATIFPASTWEYPWEHHIFVRSGGCGFTAIQEVPQENYRLFVYDAIISPPSCLTGHWCRAINVNE